MRALLVAAAVAAATDAMAQPGGIYCAPPYPPELDPSDRRSFQLAASRYFDEVSLYYSCFHDRIGQVRRQYAVALEQEIRRLREDYAQMAEQEERFLRDDKAIVDAEYQAILERYQTLR